MEEAERTQAELERRVAERAAGLEAEVRRLKAEVGRMQGVERALRESLSEQRRVEAALRVAEERWQLAVRGTNDGIWDWDVRTGEAFFSTRCKGMLGFEDHEFADSLEEWDRRIHPEDREAVWQALHDHFAHKTPFYTTEHRVLCKDGTYKWFLDRGQALWDEAGDVVRMAGSFTDITERRRLEAERERERRKLATLFANEPIGIFETDREGRNIRSNPRGCEILGLTPEGALGDGWASALFPEDAARIVTAWRAAAREGRGLSVEGRRPLPGGEVRWLAGRVAAVRDEDGAVSGFIGTLEDITERQRAEEALATANEELERRVEERTADLRREEARREIVALENERLYRQAKEAVEARDEFLTIASHELRTPITPLMLQLQSLRRLLSAGPVDERVSAKLDLTLKQVERLTKLVDNLLEVSRITTGRLELHPEECDLAEVIGDVTARFADEAARAGCEIAVRADAPVVGRWDRLRIEQVIVNLLSNAIKYAPGKPIQLEASEAGDVARLSVQDQGVGIAPADSQRIFGRFERAASTRHYAGLGLGLYITTQILQAHGGTIAVERPPAGGARFLVELPRRAA